MLFGIDAANYQAGIDMPRVAREGFDFAFCKVAQGRSYRSPSWPAMRDGARAAGLILAGYHYVDTSAAAAQAANCLAHLSDASIPVALDIEANSGGIDQWRACYDAFRAAGMRIALSYIPRWYWQQMGSPSLAGLPPLWSSRYPSSATATASQLYQNVTDKQWTGYGGLDVAVLQFASTAIVAGRQPIDVNAFLGTRDELASLLSGEAPPEEGLFVHLTEAEEREILVGMRKLKPGIAYPARSTNCRAPSDDQYGHVMNGEADAADTLAELRRLRTDILSALAGITSGTGSGSLQLSDADLTRIANVVNDELARRQAQ
jgi:hypothetical protein